MQRGRVAAMAVIIDIEKKKVKLEAYNKFEESINELFDEDG